MSSTAQYKSDRIFPQTPACDPPPARRGGFPNVVRLIREHPDFIRGLALIILILTAYRPAFHAGWIWDDDAYITNNSALRTVDGLKRIWTEPSVMTQYYPLTLTSFWAEEHLFGAAPYSFHRDNIFIHACNAVLLWLILQRLEVPAAWLIAAVWAVHPVNVETVAWASERKNLLSGFFYLLATLSYLPFVINDQRWRPGRYFLSLFSFILALFAKTVAATFPAAMLLLIWWKRGRIRRRDIVRIVPFLVAAIPMSYVTSYVEHMYIGARGPEFQYSFFHRWLIAAHAAWFYI
ncbi:MAG TPA: hypothetical protein VG722_07930, partial [Tepidisphaeraceae bacterium]|nr:hypothetical protein [Tepidisphaeraceae bacterium]